ncbi:hypothetical protein [Alienimonas sp. DA493]|uniref:hypothetical protein n=1 Tax=Alienimonas sp. DA493 TaxID=3373605 RepID=UPI003754963A
MPLTRVVKDVIRVGTYRVRDEANGGRELDWTVTEPLLTALADAHKTARSRGFATVLGKTHGDPQTRLIHPDDQIGNVGDMAVADGTLWMSAYVTPAEAKRLANPSMKVSPYILAGKADTGGHVYPARAWHVAVTDNPRVYGQGPFRIALSDPATNREVPMTVENAAPLFAVALADEPPTDAPESDAPADSGAGTKLSGAGAAPAVKLFKDIFEYLGLPLPAKVDESNVLEWAQDRLEMVKARETTPAAEVVEDGASAAVPMSHGLKPDAAKDREIADLKAELAARDQERAAEKQQAFALALDYQCETGAMTAAERQTWQRVGEKTGFDLSLLPGRSAGAALAMGDPLKQRRDGSAPSVSKPSAGQPTQEEVDAYIEARFGKAA